MSKVFDRCPLCKSEAYEVLSQTKDRKSVFINVRCSDCRAPYEIKNPHRLPQDVLEFQGLIQRVLYQLKEELKTFCQTTHMSIMSKGANLERTLDALKEVYENPDPYTISELSQHIEEFLKEEER